ncbi:MAG: hypothetical protein HYZ28_28250 [Myxococcales bacterium]|nr:hypothetical protein [Myxococcales bacterium]
MNVHLERPLLSALDALGECRLRYALVGGLAVGVWGVPRATGDVDLWAELPDRLRPKLRGALIARGFEVPDMEGELQQFGVFRSLFRPQRIFLDVFDAGNPLGEAILAHRVRARLFDRSVWLVRAEELAVLKAIADRAKDRDDLVAILRSSRPDTRVILHWAEQVDRSIGSTEVRDRFEAALRAAKLLKKPKR